MPVPQKRPDDLPANLKHEGSIRALHRIAFQGVDGSSSVFERELISTRHDTTLGSDHFLHARGPADHDADHMHLEKTQSSIRESYFIKDAGGNKFTDEKVIEIGDTFESQGRKLISNEPEKAGPRKHLLSGFNRGSLFDGQGFGMRLLSTGGDESDRP